MSRSLQEVVLSPGKWPLTVYVAASWKHQVAVELLTDELRRRGCRVLSFVENNHGEQKGHAALAEDGRPIPFDEWVWSDRGFRSFGYDTGGATGADLVIYLGPSGTDAWAEVGAAWATGVPIVGLWCKGEQAGLMRRMVTWTQDVHELLGALREAEDTFSPSAVQPPVGGTGA